MFITRIWEGRKELSEKNYFVGQRLIVGGRLNGIYISVTDEYDSKEEARYALTKWVRDQTEAAKTEI